MATKSDAKKTTKKASTTKSTATKSTATKSTSSKNVSKFKGTSKTFERYMSVCRFIIVLCSILLVSSIFFMVGYGFKEETDKYPAVIVKTVEESANNEE